MNMDEGPSDEFDKDEGVEDEETRSQASGMDCIFSPFSFQADWASTDIAGLRRR